MIAKIALLVFLVLIFGCDTETAFQEGGADLQVYFSPDDHCDEKVIDLLDKAVEELNIAVYSFTRPNIAEAVVKAHQRGIRVRVIIDAQQAAGVGSKDAYLEAQGIPVKRDDHPGYGAMHNKFAVIDRRIVITGSYNWTTNATISNDENMLVIRDPPTINRYNEEFEKIWSHSP